MFFFACTKATRMRVVQTARARAETEQLTRGCLFLQTVYCAICEVRRGRTWGHAFAAFGHIMGQKELSQSVSFYLEFAQWPAV